MKNCNIFIKVCFTIIINSCINFAFGQTLVNEDFSGESVGNVTTTASSSHYQINNNVSCSVSDGWRFSNSDGNGSSCSDCSGRRLAISYGSSSCNQDATYVSEEFTTTNSTINISFDYGYDDYDGVDQFVVTLYNESTSSVKSTLVSLTADCDDCQYSGEITGLSTSDTYSVRVQYIGDYGYGATFDNLIVNEGGITEANPLQVGSGTSSSGDGMFDNYWENNKTQLIYTSDEVGSLKTISDIQFNITQVAPAGKRDFDNFVIRMNTTSTSTFSSISYLDMSSATTVFTSSDYNMPSSTGWFSIDIDDYFYNGTDNLIIEIYWGDNGEYVSIGDEYRYEYTSTSSNYRMVYGDDDYTTQPSAESRSYKRPNIKFGWTVNPLPIELISFDVEYFEDASRFEFEWITASEANVDYYEVLTGQDGLFWNHVGYASSIGWSSTTQTHNLSTNQYCGFGWIYFILREYDLDGNMSQHGPISIFVSDPHSDKTPIRTYSIDGRYLGNGIVPMDNQIIIIQYDDGSVERRFITN